MALFVIGMVLASREAFLRYELCRCSYNYDASVRVETAGTKGTLVWVAAAF